MVAPKPYKLICEKCNYSKIIKPKSDVLNPMDFITTCPKCKAIMEREELTGISKLFAEVFK
jgi:Zn finger protein HypA/HybF involved in hydrogenase expression